MMAELKKVEENGKKQDAEAQKKISKMLTEMRNIKKAVQASETEQTKEPGEIWK